MGSSTPLVVGVTAESRVEDLKRPNWGTYGVLSSFTLGGLGGGLQGFLGVFNEKELDILGMETLVFGQWLARPRVIFVRNTVTVWMV